MGFQSFRNTLTVDAFLSGIDPLALEVTAGAARDGVVQKWYPNRDEFYWPCLSGEELPPTLAGGTTYTGWRGRPCYMATVPASVALSSRLTFPRISRVSPLSGQTTLVISWLYACDVNNLSTIEQNFCYGETTASHTLTKPGVKLWRNPFAAQSNWQFLTRDSVATQATNLDASLLPTAGFYEIAFVLYPAAVALTIDGVEIVRHSTRYWTPNEATTDNFFGYQQGQGAGIVGTGSYVSLVRARWL